MAKQKLSKADYVTLGYGQVEPNHLSAQKTGQIYAQLPAAADIDVLENGQFVKYDYKEGVVNFDGAGEWMLVFNEVKVYRDDETDADYAMLPANQSAYVYSPVEFVNLKFESPALMKTGTTMVPRVFKTNVGDIFTTNCVKASELAVGDVLTPGTDGYLAVGEGDMKWQVVKVYTLTDRQKAVKIMRIA